MPHGSKIIDRVKLLEICTIIEFFERLILCFKFHHKTINPIHIVYEQNGHKIKNNITNDKADNRRDKLRNPMTKQKTKPELELGK